MENDVVEFILVMIGISIAFKITSVIVGRKRMRRIFPLSQIIDEVFTKSDRAANEIIDSAKIRNKNKKDLKQKQKQKRQHYVTPKVQMRFGDNDSTTTYRHPNKHHWDLPNVNELGLEEDVQSSKLKNASSRGERDFIKTTGSRIKTFDEFIGPDKLQLDLKNNIQMLHDLNTGKFIVNNIEYGAEIDNVTGMSYIGKSRIDGNPVVRIKVSGEPPLVVKVNLTEHRFELIKNSDHHVTPTIPQHSNIDDYWKQGFVKDTVNAKRYNK